MTLCASDPLTLLSDPHLQIDSRSVRLHLHGATRTDSNTMHPFVSNPLHTLMFPSAIFNDTPFLSGLIPNLLNPILKLNSHQVSWSCDFSLKACGTMYRRYTNTRDYAVIVVITFH